MDHFSTWIKIFIKIKYIKLLITKVLIFLYFILINEKYSNIKDKGNILSIKKYHGLIRFSEVTVMQKSQSEITTTGSYSPIILNAK